MDYSKRSLAERQHFSWEVAYAISTQDMQKLKELLPTATDLLKFYTTGNLGGGTITYGSSVLHLALKMERGDHYSHNKNSHIKNGSQLGFLKSIFTEYDLDNQPEIKEKLLLKRDGHGRLAADYMFLVENNFLKQSEKDKFYNYRLDEQNGPDNRSEYERDKKRMYLFLKNEIKKVLPPLKEDQLHGIGKEYGAGLDKEWNTYDKGIPVTGGMYLADKDGKPCAYMNGSIKEVYPEIRLRNFEGNGKEESGCIVSDLNLEQPLLEQVINRIDFPEDFTEHFEAIQHFEKAYKKIHEDKGAFASLRYFNQNRGSLIFENGIDPKKQTNLKSGGYAGYAHHSGDYPFIVLNSNTARYFLDETILHEFFHIVDLQSKEVFSQTDLAKFSFMLAERDNNLDPKVRKIMDDVNNAYRTESFQSEVIAYIMEKEKNHYSGSPLISQIYTIAKKLSESKADELPAIKNRIHYALENMPESKELKTLYTAYMDQKEKFEKQEEQIKATTTGKEQEKALASLKENEKIKTTFDNKGFEPKRKKLERALRTEMDRLIDQIDILTHNKDAQQIVIHPSLLTCQIDGQLPEVVFADLGKRLSVESLKECIENFGKNNDDSDIFKSVYIARELWNKEFSPRRFPKEMPDILNNPKGYMLNKEKTIKNLKLFSDAMEKGLDEFDMRAVMRNGKSFDELSNNEKLASYVKDAYGFARNYDKDYGHAPDKNEKISIATKKIEEALMQKFDEKGYKRETIRKFFNQLEAANIPDSEWSRFFYNLGQAFPLLDKNYPEDLITENVLNSGLWSSDTFSQQLQTERIKLALKNRERISNSENSSASRGNLRNKIKNLKKEGGSKEEIKDLETKLRTTTPERHKLAEKLQEMRRDYGPKGKSVSKDNRTVLEMRKKLSDTK